MAYTDIGDRIRTERQRLGLSQEQLSELARLNRVTIAKYESGKVEPGAQALSRISEALEVSVDELLGRRTAEESRSMSGLMMDEKRVIDQYRRLTDEGKVKAFDYLLLLQLQYKKEDTNATD